MTVTDFASLLKQHLAPGLVLDNPGGGTSTVVWCSEERVCYRRGHWPLYVDLQASFEAYQQFNGRSVTTRELKDFAPSVYDSTRHGHDCHCTLLFLALREMGIVETIWGRGRPGAPFGVTI